MQHDRFDVEPSTIRFHSKIRELRDPKMSKVDPRNEPHESVAHLYDFVSFNADSIICVTGWS